MKILLATTNRGKIEEMRSLLSDLPVDTVTPIDLGLDLSVEETGSTYAENAILKARSYSRASNLPVLADDSGLEVDLLDGRPGLHSARYLAGASASDADRRARLLKELSGFPKPWLARFVCVVAFAHGTDNMETFEGFVQGEITSQERGENGFGYDRIFYIPALNKTMAELDMDEKNQFSHRAIAVKNALSKITPALGLDYRV